MLRNITTLLAALLIAVGVHAQSSRPQFEVASIKPAQQDGRGYGLTFRPSGFTAHAAVNMLIANAYNIPLRQVQGTSPVLLENFDVDARAAANFVPSNASVLDRNAQLRLMLQTLLADRFRLTIHQEKRETAVYTLVVAKSGPKLTPARPDTDCAMGVPCNRRGGGPTRGLLLPDTDMPYLAYFLTALVGRVVVDRTGIEGHYEITLPPWTPPDLLGTQPVLANGEPAPDPNGVSIFSLLEEKLGLRLQPTRAAVDFYVADHVERPSEN